MYIISVIPATKIPLPAPQILTYFSAQELPKGGLVSVPVHKRKATGIVVECQKINGQKMALRKADFELRGISKIINPLPFITEKQLQLADWMAKYYYCSLGASVKLLLPAKIQNSKPKTSQPSSQKLILAPEISFIEKIARQNKIKNYATLHSNQTDKQYDENWQKIKTGEAKIIIATRMALFAPFQNLKEIIVENEHDDLYKSRQTPRYHARETAMKLAKIWNAKITLKSPTPSIETSWLSEKKKILLITPSAKRQAPSKIVDLRNELKEKNFSIFSRFLQEKIESALAKKQQIILFINRRGSSTSLLCRDCGFVPRCPNCDVPFIYHLSPVQFRCHHCGHAELPPVLCPQCLGTRIKYLGTGTQKVEIEFKNLFPDVSVARFDSDTLSLPASAISARPPVIPAPSSVIPAQAGIHADKLIADFNSKKIQVLIGTQIIFNKITKKSPLIALMLADTLLYLPDFRSNERTFQTINHLKNLSSKDFIIQTYSPENKAIQYAAKNDQKSFYQEEISARETLSYPPFSQLIKLTFQHKNAKKTESEAKILSEKLKRQISLIPYSSPISILGPSPAFISKIKGRYAWQIVLKSKITDLKLRNKILSIIPPNWIIDIDPLQII